MARYNLCQGPVPGCGPAIEKHLYKLIIWYGWTLCDSVSFVADMGQQSSLNLLALNGKWSSCE